LIAARELVSADVAAVFGGIDTPVSLAMVPLLNKEKRIYMGVWAAGTGITRNGATPNYAFRVSAVDALVDVRLLAYAHKKFAAKKAGLMLINNPWGLVAAGKVDPSIEIAGIEKFENNDVDMVPQGAAQGCRRRRHHPRRQCTARCAGDEVARAHGLDGAGGVALGDFRRALPGARRSDCRRSAFHPDLQLLRQAGAGRPACAGGAHEEVSADQGTRGRVCSGRDANATMCHAPDARFHRSAGSRTPPPAVQR
jgi:hypothetical protein